MIFIAQTHSRSWSLFDRSRLIDIPKITLNTAVGNLTTSARVRALGYPFENRFLFGISTYYFDTALLDTIFGVMNATIRDIPSNLSFSLASFPTKIFL